MAIPTLLCVAANGCDGKDPVDGSETDTPATDLWEALPLSGEGRSLATVWGTASDDVWMGGGVDEVGEIHHFNGEAWTEQILPAVPMIAWIHGFGPDDVWAVGRGGAVLHFDGAAWTKLESGTTDELWGVWGERADDLWIVGGALGAGDPLILHYAEGTFTETRLAGNPKAATSMFKVWGAGGAAFAVGEAGLVERWDGTAWTPISAGPDADEDFVTVHGTDTTHIVAVGGRNSPRVATWDGAAWTTRRPDPMAVRPLSAVWARGDDDVLVGGLYGFLAAWQPSTDTFTDWTPISNVGIHAVWCADDGVCFAVGGTFAEPHRATAQRLTPAGG